MLSFVLILVLNLWSNIISSPYRLFEKWVIFDKWIYSVEDFVEQFDNNLQLIVLKGHVVVYIIVDPMGDTYTSREAEE